MNVRLKSLLLATLAACGFLSTGKALPAAPAIDYCQKQLPVELVAQLKRTYPDYRPPRSSDNLDEDVSASLKSGGNGCLAVADGDFKGTGERDLAVALTALRGGGYVVVIAEQRDRSWKVSELTREVDGRQRLYIAPTAAGHYDHVPDYEPDKSKGELDSLDCPHPGVVLGATEATGVVYCVVRGKWRHVPIVD